MNIQQGRIPYAKKMLLYGPEGIGKSTFLSKLPDPIFIDTEGSTKELDVRRFDPPSSWQMLLQQVEYVRDNPDVCKTLVIDTADWAEALCIQSVLDAHQKTGLEEFGYGTGYRYVYEEFGRLLNKLSEVIERGINVAFAAHASLRKFEQPDELGAYDRWALKMIDSPKTSIAAMLKEYVDMILFANYKTHTVTEDKEGKKKKALGSGKRVMYTTHHSCWDAKNRYGLPDELPFEYEAIAHIFAENIQKTEKVSEKPQKVTESTKKVLEPAKGKTAPPPDEEVPDKSKSKAEKEPAKAEAVLASGGIEKRLSDKIPKALRDLMVANNVEEFQIQGVVAKRGYYPEDMKIWDYDKDFIDGCLVAAWDQVYSMIEKAQKPDPDNPFLIPFDESNEKEFK